MFSSKGWFSGCPSLFLNVFWVLGAFNIFISLVTDKKKKFISLVKRFYIKSNYLRLFYFVFIGTFRKFKEKLATQNPSILKSKVSLSMFYH